MIDVPCPKPDCIGHLTINPYWNAEGDLRYGRLTHVFADWELTDSTCGHDDFTPDEQSKLAEAAEAYLREAPDDYDYTGGCY